MNKPAAIKAHTVEDALNGYEAWRQALIAFYRHESPWMTQTIQNLERGEPMTRDNRHVIDGLMAAVKDAA